MCRYPYTNQWYINKQTKHTRLTNIFIQSMAKHAHTGSHVHMSMHTHIGWRAYIMPIKNTCMCTHTHVRPRKTWGWGVSFKDYFEGRARRAVIETRVPVYLLEKRICVFCSTRCKNEFDSLSVTHAHTHTHARTHARMNRNLPLLICCEKHSDQDEITQFCINLE